MGRIITFYLISYTSIYNVDGKNYHIVAITFNEDRKNHHI